MPVRDPKDRNVLIGHEALGQGLTRGHRAADFLEGFSSASMPQPVFQSRQVCREVHPMTPTADALAKRIVETIGNDQDTKHPGAANVREVIDALARASAMLMREYLQGLPPGTDLPAELQRRIQEELHQAPVAERRPLNVIMH